MIDERLKPYCGIEGDAVSNCGTLTEAALTANVVVIAGSHAGEHNLLLATGWHLFESRIGKRRNELVTQGHVI